MNCRRNSQEDCGRLFRPRAWTGLAAAAMMVAVARGQAGGNDRVGKKEGGVGCRPDLKREQSCIVVWNI